MCGILGIGGEGGHELVQGLLPDLAHRGPDASGVHGFSGLALGHRRLAIIGLDDGGIQPMWSRSGRSVIVFNGEIYNYLEIADELEAAGREPDRRFDTSVLIEALELRGIEVLPRLNGMFAFAWYRPQEGRLLLARDRWGKKPLFWGRVELGGERRLVFSSELRSFTRLPGGPPATDPLGVARYLVYDGMPGRRTVYRGVAKLEAASWVELGPEGEELAGGRYWRFDPRPEPVSPEEAEERVEEELDRAFALRLRSDVPVGLFLSGGLDSSLLAATWRKLRPDGVLRTFTVGFDEASYDERASARRVAEAVGSEHHEIVASGAALERELDWVWDHLSEPFADPSIVPTSMVCRFARRTVKVALGGDGADELQAGYDPFRAWSAARWMERLLPRRLWHVGVKAVERLLPASPANMSARFKARHFAEGLRHPPEERIQGWMASFPPTRALGMLKPELAAEIDPEELLEPTRRAFREGRRHGELQAQIAVWIATYLESSILTKIDRASMMCSLEVRCPFLDPGLASALAALPPELVYRRGQGKVLLRRLAARRLPPEVLAKPKKGLGVPQAAWLRTSLRDRVEEGLEQSRTGGWFDAGAVEKLWRAHRSGRADFRRALWNFVFSFPFQR